MACHDPRDTAHADSEIYAYRGGHAQPATGNDPWKEGDMLARIRMEAIRQHGSRVRDRYAIRAVVPGTTLPPQALRRPPPIVSIWYSRRS